MLSIKILAAGIAAAALASCAIAVLSYLPPPPVNS